jgi:hypothetical protein
MLVLCLIMSYVGYSQKEWKEIKFSKRIFLTYVVLWDVTVL